MPCLPTYALRLSGKDFTYILAPPSTTLYNSGTVMFWFKTTQSLAGIYAVGMYIPPGTSTGYPIMPDWVGPGSGGEQPRVWLYNGVLYVQWGYPGSPVPINTGVTVNDGKWHHLALSANYSTGTLTVYLDGNQIYSGGAGWSYYTPATYGTHFGTSYLGAWVPIPYTYWVYFDGYLADIAMYNRSLSQSEVLYNMSNPLNLIRDGLIAWYPMLEGFGNVLRDYSGNGNHAQAYLAKWVQWCL